jgi:hypothetical protein
MSDPIRPISRNDAVERVLKAPRTTLLTPEEREQARRQRELLRNQRQAKEPRQRAE